MENENHKKILTVPTIKGGKKVKGLLCFFFFFLGETNKTTSKMTNWRGECCKWGLGKDTLLWFAACVGF